MKVDMLADDRHIGYGAFATVYPHKSDPTKVLKVSAHQSLISEYKILEKLKECPHVILAHGLEQYDQGQGAKRVRDVSLQKRALILNHGGQTLLDLLISATPCQAKEVMSPFRDELGVLEFLETEDINEMKYLQEMHASCPSWSAKAEEALRNLQLDLPDTTKSSLCRQMASGLDFMHKMNIVHRDLKCENMVVDEHMHLRIIDFGLAKQLSMEDMKSNAFLGKVGSTAYWCPEMIHLKSYNGVQADIWALGICVFALWSLRFPWNVASEKEAAFSSFQSMKLPPFEAMCTIFADRSFTRCQFSSWLADAINMTLTQVPNKRSIPVY